MITELFQYRFADGDSLAGHALGNLILTALADITGDFSKGIDIAARLVGARGRVVPATIDRVMLSAELLDGRTSSGKRRLPARGHRFGKLSLVPEAPRPVDTAHRRAATRQRHSGRSRQSVYQRAAAAARARDSRGGAAQQRLEGLRAESDDRTRGDRRIRCDPASRGGTCPRRDAAIRLRDLQHVADSATSGPKYAAAASHPITVTTRDIAAMRAMQVQPLGAPLASEGPLGRIRHHPARLAATIAACARFDGRRGSRPQRGQSCTNAFITFVNAHSR